MANTRPTSQLDLFSSPDVSQPPQGQIVSPSDAFRAAHPDFVEPTGVTTEYDPNTRRAAQTAHVGGGIAAALRGELEPAQVTKEDSESASGVLAASDAPLQSRLPRNVRETGLANLARIRKEQGW